MPNTNNKSKIFILDTNVILHDHTCIYQFQDNDVILPITVLEELDKFKRGNGLINFQAREFVRVLDDIVGDELFNGGKSLGKGKGKLRIETGKPFSNAIKASFREDIPDHRILAITDHTVKAYPKRKTILVSKDINLRMKAKSLGIQAEDYKTDQVTDQNVLDKTITTFENFEDRLIEKLYDQGSFEEEEMGKGFNADANECFILKGINSSVLARYDMKSKRIFRVEKKSAYGIKPRNAEQTFSIDMLMDPEIKLIALTGKAGTGKTLLALAAAIEMHKTFDQILLARPIVALSNRDLGFLPGDASEKINPYMQPLFDNLCVIKHVFNPRSQEYLKIEELQKEDKLVITPLAFIRGRSLSNAFFIIDEAQNLTPHEIKTIITRAGEGTKMIFTGDLQQIDSPYLDMKSNGLAYMTDRLRNQDIFAHINLVKGERSYLAELASNLL
ncbi:MAG: PhoH family protein [Prolixibacteraceae bacterium]|jgi:PhoH-like ATPase|nr:PhoH family protein [Prolixibacteraceae bacterium]MBT6765093.1 PhoH family protein [Prolixibacteraceae bacterium]MBT6997785.1 PhoH family protein [Prolixibacteraceae bacterium]MBT7396425.1 PhoH family protein [Prolixibacteraceae bacterium]